MTTTTEIKRERYESLDAATKRQLWNDPDWTCPHCQSVNRAIRTFCRSCGYDSDAGEFPYYNPLPPYDGMSDEAVVEVASTRGERYGKR